MSIAKPFNINKWINENRHLLKPPVGNKNLYVDSGDYIIMIVGGPNARKDYHYNETEEFYFQLEGDIVVKIMEDGKPVDISIKEGEIFLLPARTPHSPQRPANTIGLVMEVVRKGEKDGFKWFCENCGNLLHEDFLEVTDIVNQLPPVMNAFYTSDEHRTCKNCGAVMEAPIRK